MTLLAACGTAPGRTPLRVAAVGPWGQPFVASIRQGAALAVAEANAAGGVRGRSIALEFRDDRGDGARAVAIANALVRDPGVVAVIGNLNSGTLAAAAQVYDGRLPALSPTAVAPELRGISPWVFRLLPDDSVFGIALGRNASRLGRRAAILYDNDAFGRGGARAFRQNFRGALIADDPVRPGAADLEPFVSYYRQQGVDLVYAAAVAPTGAALLAEARWQGFTGRILGTDSWVGLAKSAPAVADGALLGVRFSILEPRPEVVRFARAFRARYGREPDNFAALGYDAARLIVVALREGGTHRADVRRYLAGLGRDGFPGVTGAIRFDAAGGPRSSRFVLLRIQNGALVVAGADDSA